MFESLSENLWELVRVKRPLVTLPVHMQRRPKKNATRTSHYLGVTRFLIYSCTTCTPQQNPWFTLYNTDTAPSNRGLVILRQYITLQINGRLFVQMQWSPTANFWFSTSLPCREKMNFSLLLFYILARYYILHWNFTGDPWKATMPWH